jgi:hypothetical protein
MAFTIANYYDADRRSARATEDIAAQGMVVKVSNSGGERMLTKLADADAALLVPGNYGVVYKVSTDALQVVESAASANATVTGDRIVKIRSGDDVVEVRRGAICEYSADLLHASLDPARAGTTPVAGEALAIKGSQWCDAAEVGAIISPVVGRVFQVRGTSVLVEIL